MSLNKAFYAVRKGRKPGIYLSWPECLKQVSEFKGAEYKKFSSLVDAEDFITFKEKFLDKLNTYLVFCDGGSRSNPGIAGCGAAILLNNKIISSSYEYLGKKVTNNVAEYKGLILGMNIALANDLNTIEVLMDSNLIVKQMKNEWKVHEPDLQVLHKSAKDKSSNFLDFKINYIPRERNSIADELANLAMDLSKQN
ncbi:hypothetical protein SteCoe_33515 [Stentor coeruleus]|uniref:Ribonuclease H n=1 Tax=Stentor coeruleus TaxID=5963 RepID=A0A1R2AWK8_9CILI|nr:hypothetical protein SteCoe_33515 [Stentor coeruleus]